MGLLVFTHAFQTFASNWSVWSLLSGGRYLSFAFTLRWWWWMRMRQAFAPSKMKICGLYLPRRMYISTHHAGLGTRDLWLYSYFFLKCRHCHSSIYQKRLEYFFIRICFHVENVYRFICLNDTMLQTERDTVASNICHETPHLAWEKRTHKLNLLLPKLPPSSLSYRPQDVHCWTKCSARVRQADHYNKLELKSHRSATRHT